MREQCAKQCAMTPVINRAKQCAQQCARINPHIAKAALVNRFTERLSRFRALITLDQRISRLPALYEPLSVRNPESAS